jgi:hypothetical protein
MRMIRNTLIALALFGCSAAGAIGPDVRAPLVLTPDADSRAATVAAVEAWNEATGLGIVVGEGGVPVQVVDELDNCGETNARVADGVLVRIAIRRATPAPRFCGEWERTLRHEIGHAIRYWAIGAAAQLDEHTAGGLMGERANRATAIDAEALELTCADAPCAWMQNVE